MAVHNVRFATTAYTHMYENDYMGRPEEKYRRGPNDLTGVGIRVERWRAHAGLKPDDFMERVNERLGEMEQLDVKTYRRFLRGKTRISDRQIRAIAKALGTTLHIMTRYSPGEIPKEEERPKPPKVISISPAAERAERKRKAQGTPRPKPVKPPAPYDADAAAQLLARKYGNKVKRA